MVSKQSNQSFPANHRLLHSRDFDAVFAKCDVRVSNPAFLFLAKRNRQGFNRLGMVISKKNLPLAVERNRVKRLVREAFRRHGRAGHFDIVVLAKPGARRETDLVSAISQLFEEIMPCGEAQP